MPADSPSGQMKNSSAFHLTQGCTNLSYLRYSWIIFLLFIFCESNGPIQPEQFSPTLSNLSIPDTVLTGVDQSYIFSVKCEDQNGLEDIDSVLYRIVASAGGQVISGMMFDDGDYALHGDNVPKDGKYSVRLKFSIAPGQYEFIVQAVDRAQLRSQILGGRFHAQIGEVNHAPIIVKLRIPDSVCVDQIVPFSLSVTVIDPDVQDAVSRVVYQILEPNLTNIAEQGEMNDRGINGDSLAGDGIFSIETTTAFANWKFGNYYVNIQAFDSRNKASDPVYQIIYWKKNQLGLPPQLLSIAAPDTIQLPASGDRSFLLTAKVSDPDDNRDIKEVFFNTFKPNGSPSSGNPFKMYDDGTSGDLVANDFTYSLTIFITAQNSPGDYRFEFQAKDYSDLLSEKIIHIITVIK